MKRKIISIITLLIIVMSYVLNASVVSDNDGSAFITKAEFDSLKNTFQSQIDTYNQGIDSKIDSAIASYLAGIVVETEKKQTSIINNITPKFGKGKTFGSSDLGTYYKFYIAVAYAHAPPSCRTWTDTSVTPNVTYSTPDVTYVFEGSSTSWYSPIQKEKNSTDKEYLYNITKTTVNGTSCYKINYLQQSTYTASLTGGAAGDRSWNTTDKTSYYVLDATTYDRGTLTNFGARTVDISFSQGNSALSTAKPNNENASATWGFTDTKQTDDTLEYLCGEKMNDTDDVYCMLDTDVNKLGDTFATTELADNQGGARRSNNWVPIAIDHSNGSYTSKLQIKLYRHKVTKLKQTDFVAYAMSNAYGNPLKFYEGCPIFKANSEGKCTIKLKFENDSASNTTFEIKNDKFTNVAVKAAGGATGISNCTNTTWTVSANQELQFTFDAKQGETYWIKALPASGATKITTTDIKITAS